MLEIDLAREAAPNDAPLRWISTLKVGEGRYVRSRGAASFFPETFAQVLRQADEHRQIGGLAWWVEAPAQTGSWSGSLTRVATELSGFDWETERRFERGGETSTFEETAMRATLGRVTINGSGGHKIA